MEKIVPSDELSILLEFKNEKIPSVNSIYVPHKYTKKPVLTDGARLFKRLINDQLTITLKNVDLTLIKQIPKYKLYLEFVLKSSFTSRDYDNMIKLVQDSLFKFIGENDAKIIHGEQLKFNRNNGTYEFIFIKLSKSEFDYNKYNK